jgi:hypothetical protein
VIPLPVYWIDSLTGEVVHTDKGMEDFPAATENDPWASDTSYKVQCMGCQYTSVEGEKRWTEYIYNSEWGYWSWEVLTDPRQWWYGAPVDSASIPPPVRMNQRDDGNGVGENHPRLQHYGGAQSSSVSGNRIMGDNAYR